MVCRSAAATGIWMLLSVYALAGCETSTTALQTSAPRQSGTQETHVTETPANILVAGGGVSQSSGIDSTHAAGTNPDSYVVARDVVDSKVIFTIATPRQINPDNTLYVSHNGGRSWTPLRNPLGSNIQQVHFINRSTGMIYGGPQRDPTMSRTAPPPAAYRTVDGGQHWTPVRLPDSLIATSKTYGSPDVRCLNTPGSLAWMFCYWNNQFPKYALYHSSDDGVTWTNAIASIGPDSALTVPAVGALDPNQAYLVTFCEKCAAGPNMTGTDTLQRTLDGGRTWHSVQLPFKGADQVESLRFKDNSHGMATVTDGITGRTIWYSTSDGGRTWTPVRHGVSANGGGER